MSKQERGLRRRSLRRLLVEQLEGRRLLAADVLDLSALNGTNGFRITGIDAGDWSSYSVSGAGDVNGDGFDDLIIGAFRAEAPSGGTDEGESYVVFGKSGGFSAVLDLSTLNGANGFRITGNDAGDWSGYSVSGAGDINGDGFDDLIIGAPLAEAPSGGTNEGESYVVFGKSGGFSAVLDLSTLNGGNGFRITGIDANDRTGISVGGAGDINADGFDDLIIGASRAEDPSGGTDAGASFVMFGKSGGFSAALDLSTLNGFNGFRIMGVDANDRSGYSVGSAGDVNGDGFDDLIIGVPLAESSSGDTDAGESYVVFGKSWFFGAVLNLSTLNGTNGFRISGIDAGDWSGISVSGAGDVNGDGFDDLIVGARFAEDPFGGANEGESYVVFGKSGGFSAVLDLSTLNGTNGFRINGVDAYDTAGRSVSGAGDVNGDGFDDLIIGAPTAAESSSGMEEGASYVVFGKSGGFSAVLDLGTLNGTNGFRITGIDAGDRSGWSVSGAGDVNGDGFDDLIIGAPRADQSPGDTREGESYVVFGGNFSGGVETQVGSDGHDTLIANQGPGTIDILIGGQGNDILISDGGDDVLRGGEGDDVLAIPDINFSGTRRLLGGKGNDTLRLDGSSLILDLTAIPDNRIVDIEEIDLSSGLSQLVVVTMREVLNLSSYSNTLTVRGTGSRVRLFDIGWSAPVLVNIGGTDFRRYTNGAAILNIQTTLTTHAPVLYLSTLNGTNGFRIVGVDPGDRSGWSVSSAGDVNGDGFDDLIIGAPYAEESSGGTNEGAIYVVFGKSGGFSSVLDLSTLNGANGFRIIGVDANDQSGFSVSGAGDVNGDGFDDLIIGARFAEAGPSSFANEGASYVVLGKSGGFSSVLDLRTLNGANGFRIVGVDANDQSGFSVSVAGDINGDGFHDLIIGAPHAEEAPSSFANEGASYVVFGKSGGFSSVLDLRSLNGTNGFRIVGVDAFEYSGFSVSGAGDINGDGFDDLIIGAPYAEFFFDLSGGASYVVFGKSTGFSPVLNLSTLNGTNGFSITGIYTGDRSGWSVSGVGDVNGDGFDDLIIGSRPTDHRYGTNAGVNYVVFGKSGGFSAGLDLGTLNGTNGFRIWGTNSFGYSSHSSNSSFSVSGAGDINGDGFDDLIIGALWAEKPFANENASYVLFGKSGGFSAELDLRTLNSAQGFRIIGVNAYDYSGFSVSSASDVNGDGFDDFIIGARSANPIGRNNAGESYVVFGGNFTGGSETQVGTDANDILIAIQGALAIDILIGGRGNDILISDGGGDVLRGGEGDDILVIPDVNFSGTRRLLGGSGHDTLRLEGRGHVLDLTAVADNRIVDIEEIDLGSGRSHEVLLAMLEVLKLSSHSNTLTVRGTGSRLRFLDSGWSVPVSVNIGGSDFHQYTNGAATLNIQTTITTYASAFDLRTLNGTNGFRIAGVDPGDRSGWSVSGAGDVNGDGFDDLIIGAPYAEEPSGGTNAGASYVVFGKSGGFSSVLDLSALNGSNGFRIKGINPFDYSGTSAKSAGDINGDGFDDLIIGAPYAEGPSGGTNEGASFVVFGKSGGFSSVLDLSTLNGTNGFRILGVDAFDYSSFAVSGVGDVNGDGFDDLIIGAPYAETPSGSTNEGASYVVFGKSDGFSAVLDLSTLNGTNGFRIKGIDAFDYSGWSVGGAGDVNGDGFDDLIIGAPRAEDPSGGTNEGASYVVFGKSGGFSSVLDLSTLNGTNGFRILGVDAFDYSGFSVSGAGDLNGDGFDDLVIGAPDAEEGLSSFINEGASYVVFGKSGGFSSVLGLSTLDGTDGFRITGIDIGDFSGWSMSGAGDVNGDGFDDLIIGVPRAEEPSGGLDEGASYVVFGKSGGFSAVLDLSTLIGTDGFRITGIDAGDFSGWSVSGAGDVNGDGFDDLIVGARGADPYGRSNAGESYVVFGGNFIGGGETQVGTDAADTLTATQGSSAIDILIGGRGNDILISDGGDDVLRGGEGDDILAIPDVNFSGTRLLAGGSGFDTLRLDGSGHILDLTVIPKNRIVDIEQIDITGSGNNTLILSAREVLNLSSHSNSLVVRRNVGDVINMGPGWTQQSNEVIGSDTFEVFTQGAAKLKIQFAPAASTIVGSFVAHLGYSGSGAAIDTGKVLAKEGATPTLLSYDNLINTSRGINGLVFDIDNLTGTPTAADFVFQVSPTGAFDLGANPTGSWAGAPAPSSVNIISGSPNRVFILWLDNAIENRWLRITVLANGNTGLLEPEIYYIGHLLGETTGPSGSVFTVSFADIALIRSGVGSTVNASSTVDIDKNGTVSFADIAAMRASVGAQLAVITIPAASVAEGEGVGGSRVGGGIGGGSGMNRVIMGSALPSDEALRHGKVPAEVSRGVPPIDGSWGARQLGSIAVPVGSYRTDHEPMNIHIGAHGLDVQSSTGSTSTCRASAFEKQGQGSKLSTNNAAIDSFFGKLGNFEGQTGWDMPIPFADTSSGRLSLAEDTELDSIIQWRERRVV